MAGKGVTSRGNPLPGQSCRAVDAGLQRSLHAILAHREAASLEQLAAEVQRDPITVHDCLQGLIQDRKISRLSPAGLNGSASPRLHAHLLYYRLRRPADDANIWRLRFS